MRDPTHFGKLDNPTGVGAVGNPACGDVVTLQVRLRGDTVEIAVFESIGSTFQLATASVLCDVVVGMPANDVLAMSARPVIDRLEGLPRAKYHLARLALDALQLAVTDALDAPAVTGS
jgi:nitrogen fixation NifU-like protein